ncbi:MAG: hypothetical protein M1358_18635 [Chloroflexi bacterium]|nr:hypothetical protein [Chloroflexota bacterium]
MVVFKVLLRLIIRGGQQIASHKVSSAIVALLLIALVFVSTAKFSQPGAAQASVGSVTQPSATANYFMGQRNFDSSLIWSSLSTDLISQAEGSGATQQDLQDQLDQARELGRGLQGVSYIGGHALQNGGSMHFYVATVSTGGVSSEADEIFYVFTLDKDGKIEKIE